MFNWKKTLLVLSFLVALLVIVPVHSQVTAHKKLSVAHHSPTVVAQTNLDDVEIKTIPLRDNLYMLMGEGGNIGVSVGDDGAMIIDSQFSGLTNKIQQAIAKINSQPINYLINTHYHFDHTDGNGNFADAGVTIIAHDNVPKQMSIDHEYAVLGMKREAASVKALPKITFSDDLRFALNDNYIHAFHLPFAHTDGDTVIHFTKQNVIHTGDLFFNGFYPFIDTGVGGSVDGMIKAIDRILPLCNQDTLIIPGHGPLAKKSELVTFQEMLKTVDNRVKESIAKNITLEQMITTNILADIDQTWGDGFLTSEQFLNIAYLGIANQK